MTNKEFYAKEIVEASIYNKNFAVTKNGTEVKKCEEIDCKLCLFFEEGCFCDKAKLDWANGEYRFQLLNTQEKEYLKAIIKPVKEKVTGVSRYPSSLKYDMLAIYLHKLPPTTFYIGENFANIETNEIYTLKDLDLE